MPEGPPYVLDFLQQIINVQFGGQWMTFAVIWSDIHNQTVTLEFPGESGGTPGFAIINGGSIFAGAGSAPASGAFPFAAALAGYPPVKATDLTKKLRTGGGSSFNGFGAGNSEQGVVSMQVGSGIIPSTKKFSMRGRMTGDNNAVLLFGGFVKKNTMKVGKFPTKFATSSGDLDLLFEFDSDKTFTMTVDPVAFTMTVD